MLHRTIAEARIMENSAQVVPQLLGVLDAMRRKDIGELIERG